MIEAAVGFIALFGLIALMLLKAFNVMKQGKTYSAYFIFIGFALAWIFWLLFFMCMGATFLVEETITTPGGETYTVEDNSYTTYSMFLSLNNLFIGLTSLLTFLEVVFIFSRLGVVRKPLKARGGKNAFWD